MPHILFEDIFKVHSIDPDGKPFSRVSRLHCNSECFKMEMILDVNTWVYPLKLNEKFRLILADRIRQDGLPEVNQYSPSIIQNNLAESFEYIMYGKIYRMEGDELETETIRLSIYVSFGGLLMQLSGNVNVLNSFAVDRYIYLLIKKLAF